MARSLRCPRCSTVVTVEEGQAPVCPSCGFGGPAPPIPAAPPAAPAPAPASPGFSSPPQPQQAYGQTWGAPQERTDGLSVAALVTGCLSFLGPVLGLILGILAIVFGIQGMNRCKRTPGLKGHGMAMAGLIVGSVFVAIWLIFILVLGAALATFARNFR